MNGAWEAGALLQSTLSIWMLPTGLWVVNRLLLRHLDNRGMYLVPPFSWLPWLAAALLASAALDGLDITAKLTPAGIWLTKDWDISLDELYTTWLNPWEILFAILAAVIEMRIEGLANGWRPILLMLTLVFASLVAILAWRSWQALRGLFLYLWQSLVYMVLIYMFVIGTAWMLHWLNFWLLPVTFIFLYMYDKDLDVEPRSPL